MTDLRSAHTAQCLPDAVLMALFDLAEPLDPAARRMAMAAALMPDQAQVAHLGVGDAERLFWRAKCDRFGPMAVAEFACDACGEAVGFAVPAGFDLPARTATTARVAHAGRIYHLTCPTLGASGPQAFDAIGPGAPWDDPDFRARAAAALDAADPAMDLIFDVACPACGADNPRTFDAALFLWADIAAFAATVLAEVATLARAFGWTEPETLALSPARRSRYIAWLA